MPDTNAVGPVARPGRALVTLGVLVGLALGAVDSTIVGTAMPKIVEDLHGLELYFLVTAAYLLTSTVTTPVWGRLADLYGRRPIHLLGVIVFLVGSGLCGSAESMIYLVVCRGIQGVGAGALLPISFTMVADLYPLEQRGRMQGLVGAVWGLSSIMGPPLGGFITEHLSWRWVFYVNVPIGLLSSVVVQTAWKEPRLGERRGRVDVAGAALTLLSTGSFLAACALLNYSGPSAATLIGFAAAPAAAALLVFVERRARDPFILHDLFRIRLFSAGVVCGAFAGVALFCATTYITLYMQAVLGSTVKASGLVLVPMTLSWVVLSTLVSPLSLRTGYRPLALVGMGSVVASYALLSSLDGNGTWMRVAVPMGLLGAGLGCVLTPLLIGAQNAVPREQLGAATSLTQFSRAMVGSIGVAVMGVLLSAETAKEIPPGMLGALLNPVQRAAIPSATVASLRDAMAAGLHDVFLVGLIAAVAGLVSALAVPGGSGRALAIRRGSAGELPPESGA